MQRTSTEVIPSWWCVHVCKLMRFWGTLGKLEEFFYVDPMPKHVGTDSICNCPPKCVLKCCSCVCRCTKAGLFGRHFRDMIRFARYGDLHAENAAIECTDYSTMCVALEASTISRSAPDAEGKHMIHRMCKFDLMDATSHNASRLPHPGTLSLPFSLPSLCPPHLHILSPPA